ncbi:AAA-ATPase At1g43910 [Linum perenne]
MAKQHSLGWPLKRWLLALLIMLSISTVIAFFIRAAFDSCDRRFDVAQKSVPSSGNAPPLPIKKAPPSPLSFMKSKRVLLVSHELSLSGGPLLLMELAFLLRSVGAGVFWITVQKPLQTDEVIYSLEQKMLVRGVQVISAKGQEATDAALKADLVVLNTAVAGKWLDPVLKENVSRVLPKVLWWIHEMRGHYFKLDYIKHLPSVAGAMIDSHVTAEYWKNRTQERLRINMPVTYVVHLGNSIELMEVAEDSVAKRVLREHIRESLGLRDEDLLFGIINSVSRGKGQDLFLRSFYESLQLIRNKKVQVPSVHAVIVGSDMGAQTKFETELRNYVIQKRIQHRVHFVNKTLTVAPYLAAIDVLVQNSQGRGECFGRITIEAMAFQLPVLGTAAGGTREIVVNGTTGLLHQVGKEGISALGKNMVKVASEVERRLTMGKRGYQRVKERFLEHHMAHRIADVLKDILRKSKDHPHASDIFSFFARDFIYIIDEDWEAVDNETFRAAQIYLPTIVGPTTRQLLLGHNDNNNLLATPLFGISPYTTLVHYFRGVKIEWTLYQKEVKAYNRCYHRQWYELRCTKKNRSFIAQTYIPHVCKEAERLFNDREILHIYTYDKVESEWQSTVFKHAATFDTLAMDPDRKQEIIHDLDLFVQGKEFYKSVGRAWKRGYLLYGPPGTGKSTMVAAIANYLKFHIYDLQLQGIQNDSELRQILTSTKNRSILLIEDIDCTTRSTRPRSTHNRTESDSDSDSDSDSEHSRRRRKKSSSSYREGVTLSGLLNFIDGIWSSCGDERIIIFTTNHKEKLDPALLRPGRMDRHIYMGHCTFSGFKLLADKYLGVQDHVLYEKIEGMIQENLATPAEVAQQLMKINDPDAALNGLLEFLTEKANEEKEDENKGCGKLQGYRLFQRLQNCKMLVRCGSSYNILTLSSYVKQAARSSTLQIWSLVVARSYSNKSSLLEEDAPISKKYELKFGSYQSIMKLFHCYGRFQVLNFKVFQPRMLLLKKMDSVLGKHRLMMLQYCIHCERFMEFLIDLVSRLPTRRYLRHLFADVAVVSKCHLSVLYTYRHEKGNLFAELVDLLQFYERFEINDHLWTQLTDDEVLQAHYDHIYDFQLLAPLNKYLNPPVI